MNKIPLRNRKKEIIAYTIVSPEHFEHLNQFRWCKVIIITFQKTIQKYTKKLMKSK